MAKRQCSPRHGWQLAVKEIWENLHVQHDHPSLLKFILNISLDDVSLGDGAAVPNLVAVEGGMGASYQDNLVPSIQGGAAGRANAVVALQADDDDLRSFRDQLPELGALEGVVFPLVNHGFVWEWREEKLPAGGVWLVWLTSFAIVTDVYDTRRMTFRAGFGEDVLDVLAHGVGCRYAAVFWVSKEVFLYIYEEEHATSEARWLLAGRHGKQTTKVTKGNPVDTHGYKYVTSPTRGKRGKWGNHWLCNCWSLFATYSFMDDVIR